MYKITYFASEGVDTTPFIKDYLVLGYNFKIISQQFFKLELIRDDKTSLTLIHRCDELQGLKIVELEDV